MDPGIAYPIRKCFSSILIRSYLASVFALVGSAEHLRGDLPVESAVVCCALGVVPDPQVDLLDHVGHGAAEVDRSPAWKKGACHVSRFSGKRNGKKNSYQ